MRNGPENSAPIPHFVIGSKASMCDDRLPVAFAGTTRAVLGSLDIRLNAGAHCLFCIVQRSLFLKRLKYHKEAEKDRARRQRDIERDSILNVHNVRDKSQSEGEGGD